MGRSQRGRSYGSTRRFRTRSTAIFEEQPTRETKQYVSPACDLISLLQDIQEEYRYLPEDKLRKIARDSGIPLSEIYGVATFYKSFSLVPKGRNIVTVCKGTACHVRGSARLSDEVERFLNIKPGGTTPNGDFSFETVNCLGCCALGPVMLVNGRYYGGMTSSRAISLLKRQVRNSGATNDH